MGLSRRVVAVPAQPQVRVRRPKTNAVLEPELLPFPSPQRARFAAAWPRWIYCCTIVGDTCQ